ncbi:MAG: efflux RND transporter permease subunit [Novosphingobium sp.]
MLDRLVRWCVANAWVVLTLAAILFVYGILVVNHARYDVFPEFVPAQVAVQTESPGLVAEQVEALVTRPLENAINGANGVETVRSESSQGLSVIRVTFHEGADPLKARQVIAEALTKVSGQLPSGVAAPTLSPLTSSTMDLLKVGLVSDRIDQRQLRALAEWTIKPRLLATRGVAGAMIYGSAESRFEVHVRPEALVARQISLADVSAAVSALTTVRGGGFAETANQRILVRPTNGKIDATALGNALIVSATGPAIRLRDVADIALVAGPEIGEALIMGRPGVLISMSSQFGANTLDTTRAIEATLAELRPTFAAQGVRIYPALHRPANFIEVALRGMSIDLLIGAAMIALILIAFLRDVRVALIAFLAIPLSLLAALIVLDLLGQTINTMTLGGLTVALGVVVDDAVVDVENIVRRLRGATGGDRRKIIADASVEVRAPVVYATYVLALTIAPILFLTGLQGAFFSPLALAILLAVIASLCVAITLTPALAYLLLARTTPHDEPLGLARAKAWHRGFLTKICARPILVVGWTAVTGLVGIVGMMMFGGELLPAFREGHYVLKVNGPPGASMAWMRESGARLSHDLLAIPQIATVEQQIGRAEAGEDPFPPHESEIHVELKPGGASSQQAALDAIRRTLANYPALQTETLTFLGDRIGESLSGETAQFAVSIYGPDLDVLDRTAMQVAQVIGQVPGSADVRVKSPPGTPVLTIELDPARMAAHGVSPADANDAIEIAFQGHVAGQVAEADRVTDVAVVLPTQLRRDPESVADILVRYADGSSVKLGDIATVYLEEGRSSVSRDGGQRRQIVTLNPTRKDIAGFARDARNAIAAKVKLPAGVTLSYTGVAEGQAAATRQVIFNVAIAAVAIIGLLVLAFGGLRSAALILAGTPFALVGGVVAVGLSGGVLSLGALVGFVTLFGIAARNAILLVSHLDHLVVEEGEVFGLATVLRAAEERVTPILMTALVTALGLLPLALETGQAGREIQGPMALVILCGLVTSTIMSLLFLPALILRFGKSTSDAILPRIEAIDSQGC